MGMISKRGFISLGRWEAMSLILLLGIAIPLKYLFGLPLAVRIVGSLHGVLFLAYVAIAVVVAKREGWGAAKLIRCWVASCVPCGTLLFERELQNRTSQGGQK
jgi:integral membrane protein